jgi:hypothetical protein
MGEVQDSGAGALMEISAKQGRSVWSVEPAAAVATEANAVARRLATIIVLVVVGALALSAPTSAHATKYCDAIRVQHKVYSVSSHGLSCRRARRWTERYVRRSVEPKGWKCSSGGCWDQSSNASFTWFHPFDRGQRALPTMTVGFAKHEIRKVMMKRFSWFQYGPGRVRGCKHLSRTRVRCGVKSAIADIGLRGHVAAWYKGPNNHVRTAGKVRVTNWDCVFIQHKPKHKCTRTSRWG